MQSIVWYGLPVYQSAYVSLKEGNLSMDTIITLGSFCSFLLSFIQILSYSGQSMQIKEIIDSLSTTGIILTVTYVGRQVEKQAKNQILNSQSILIQNHKTNNNYQVYYFAPKNKRLDLEETFQIHIALIEEGDFFQV